MSKKKNTLKDLDEFLKQQAAALVTPTQLAAKIETPKKSDALPAKNVSHSIREEDAMLGELRTIAEDRNKLYELIVKSVESQDRSLPEDAMLINTALYLQSGENWKEVIRKYWKSR